MQVCSVPSVKLKSKLDLAVKGAEAANIDKLVYVQFTQQRGHFHLMPLLLYELRDAI